MPTLKYVFDSKSDCSSMFPMPVENSVNFTFVHNLILQNNILVLHIIIISYAHSCDGDRLYLAD